MVRNYKKRHTRGVGVNWTNEDMMLAVECVKNGLKTIRSAAIIYKVPPSTLQLKVNGWKGRPPTSTTGVSGRPKTIPLSDEEKLAKFLKIMSKWGFGLCKNEVLSIVEDYIRANEIKCSFKDSRPGHDWFRSFCSRNNLSMKKPELLEGSRARQSNDPFVIMSFYTELSKILKELKLEEKPESIYNCDESGFLSDPVSTKVVTAKGLPAKRVTGGNARKTTTVLSCVNAVGQKMSPFIIHKGKNIWNTMIGDQDYPGTRYGVSENGWMTEKLFKEWFISQFLTQIKSKPALLIYDGHLSHISIELIEAAINSDVTILKLPPHTSHILQPLDVSVFKGVKSKWDEALVSWTRENYGKQLPRSVFSNVFAKVWMNVKVDVIKSGFDRCGIHPFNSTKIDDKFFDPEKLQRYKSMENSIIGVPLSPQTQNDQIEEISVPIVSNSGSTQAQDSPSPSKTFENLLLRTVTPKNLDKPLSKKRRIENAEIITKEAFLQNLKEIDDKKKLIEEVKNQSKIKRANAKLAKNFEKTSKIKKKAEPKNKKNVSKDPFPKKKYEKRCVF